MNEKIFRDEQGFSTLSMTISLLLSLCLVFTSAQVYRIQSASAQVQDVADAAALAAQNEVAEFMVVAQVCDAVTLSLALASTVSTGAGVVCLCVPPAFPFWEGFFEAGQKFAQAKNSFLRTAKTGLEAYQKALPFIAAAKAALVARANGQSNASAYHAIALSFPLQGDPIDIADSTQDDQDFFDEIQQDGQQVKEASTKAEQAAEEALEAKERGFQADCGAVYCMQERASSLAGLSGAQNPRYSSVDTWSFQVALQRARAYYATRLSNEAPASADPAEISRSAVRSHYYRYACEELQKGYVYETDSDFSAYFPTMPRNMQQMCQTTLYTQAVYPVTEDAQGAVMHGCANCPGAAGFQRMGSVQELEQGDFHQCSQCGFQAATLGNVAAATSSVETGFEYHYLKVAQAAEDYQKAMKRAKPHIEQAKQSAQSLFDRLWDYAKTAQSSRIKVNPPGRYGAIAVAFDSSAQEVKGFSFSGGTKSLGPRVAVAGSALLADSSAEGASVLSGLLDGLSDEAKLAMGPTAFALRCWSGLLEAYGSGQEALTSALEDALNRLPLIGASGLGTWADDAFKETMERLGLQPAQIDVLKPVLVNTGHVAAAADTTVAHGYTQFKEGAMEGAQAIDGVLAWSNYALSASDQGVSLVGTTVEIAQFSPFGDQGPSFSVEVPLPGGVQDALDGALASLAAGINGAYQWLQGATRWR